jgi:hypothetical protein
MDRIDAASTACLLNHFTLCMRLQAEIHISNKVNYAALCNVSLQIVVGDNQCHACNL